MTSDLQLARTDKPAPGDEATYLIQSGADLVYAAEDLYLRLFALTLFLLMLCSGWSVWARLEDAQRGNLALTFALSGFGALAATVGLLRRRHAYCWLRHDRSRQIIPGVAAALMMLIDGPHSATWWMAFALLFVTASVASTTLTLTAAIASAAAYLGGTLLYGSPLVYRGDTSNVIGAAMLIVNASVGRAVAEIFGSLTLRLHRVETELRRPRPPVVVPNLAERPSLERRTAARSRRSAPRSPTVVVDRKATRGGDACPRRATPRRNRRMSGHQPSASRTARGPSQRTRRRGEHQRTDRHPRR